MVNDMRMDCLESSRLMNEGAGVLKDGGLGVLTLKLTENAGELVRRARQAEAILREKYVVIGMRQLFHNRDEVTVALCKR